MNSGIVNSQEYINNTLDKLQYIYGTIEIRMRPKPSRDTQLKFQETSALPSLTRGAERTLRRTDDRWLGAAGYPVLDTEGSHGIKAQVGRGRIN
jgi:hypothetical protein